MSVRTRAGTRVRTEKAFGSVQSGPQAMLQAARDISQMGPQHPFSPGEPIGPYDGYSRTPRASNYPTGVNIATRPRTHERTSFEVLSGLIEAYDVADICIWHKIDTLRGLRWKLLAADNYRGDVAGAIELGQQVLRKPDGINGFRAWFGKWFFDVLAWDAAPLYRLRNRGGKVIGLMPFDGRTLAPLMDYWGNPPVNPGAPPDEQPEAYVQYVNGLPWNWLTRADVIYEPFRAVNSSLYGKAPIESIILNANTDLRFQLYFLQRFTEGNIPAAFANAPETWTPDDIENFQNYWNSYMYADQTRKSQVQWIPGGSTLAWSNEKDFTDAFSLFLMRKTCASFHIVPTDLGFTETSNYSSGESQADVQHKAGELPPMEYAEEILSRFLYDDFGLPVKFEFDRGEDQDDRLVQAQADQIYIEEAVVSSSEIREMRFGLPEPEGQTVPRIFMTTRAGPVPLASLMGIAGKIDPETGAPAPGTALPREAFIEVPGVVPNPPLTEAPLAEQEFGPSAIPPAPPMQPVGIPEATDPAKDVAKEDGGAPTTGITSETGLVSYDLIGRKDDDEDGPDDQTAVAKAELAAFRRFAKTRRQAGEWRDFRFEHAGPVRAHTLNDGGRLAVRKAAGEVAVAGLAVQAADTGRVLMLQRALDPDDPAGGTWEFPGGHLEGDEKPVTAAAREWCEEVGCILPFEPEAMAALAFGNGSSWTSASGIYQGFVYPVQSEASVPVRCGTVVSNPDDPDGDRAEAIAWWDPADLPGNSALRPELLADIGAVMTALGAADPCCGCSDCCGDGCCQGAGGCPCGPADTTPSQGAEDTCPCGTPVVYDESNGWQHADGSVSHDDDSESVSDKMAAIGKAADGPKAQAPDGAPAWAGWRLTDKAVAWWAPQVTSAVTATLAPSLLNQAAADYLAANPQQQGGAAGKKDRNDAALAWLTAWLTSHDASLNLSDAAAGIATDGYLIGTASAAAALDGTAADLGAWKPGDTGTASGQVAALGAGDGLAAFLAALGTDALTAGVTSALARQLAGADGDSDPGDLGRTLAGTVADAAVAAGLVLAALCASVSAAAMAWYAHAPTATFQWVTDPTLANCVICLGNEAAPARPFGEPWPSGDTDTNIHVKCGCALVRA